MRPALCHGDLILASLDGSEPMPGDVVVLQAAVGVVVHRVVARTSDAAGRVHYLTAGDANRREDDFLVPREAVLVITRARLPGLGYPSLWARAASAALARIVRRECW